MVLLESDEICHYQCHFLQHTAIAAGDDHGRGIHPVQCDPGDSDPGALSDGNGGGRFTTVILLILIIGGFIMLSLGVIGHYIARIYEEVKGRPKYIISHVTENVPGTAVGSWKREHRES